MIPSWSSCDEVAEVYDEVAGELYFKAPARDLVAHLHIPADGIALDIGTGTGIVAEALPTAVVGCDASMAMIRRARKRVPQGRFAMAALPDLPFPDQSFDVVTMSFVLSHVRDAIQALREARRALKIDGEIGHASWSVSPGGTMPGAAWYGVAHRFIPPEELQEATARSIPSEGRLASAESVVSALREAGFHDPRVVERSYRIDVTTDDYIESRMMSLPARYMISRLAPADWNRFVTETHDVLKSEFGERLSFDSSVNLAIARR